MRRPARSPAVETLSENSQRIVFVVDDDAAVRHSIELLLRAEGLLVLSFADAESFLAHFRPPMHGCLVCDLNMPGLSGLELQAKLHQEDAGFPVIILTGQGSVPAAVQAMKTGAIDFIEKPFDAGKLTTTVHQSLARNQSALDESQRHREQTERLQALTPREQEVLQHLADGKANKVVAADLGISERTVEVHRSRVMRKLNARSVADLVHLAEALASP